MNEQLILNLSRRQAFNREDFFVSKSNSRAVKSLENWKKILNKVKKNYDLSKPKGVRGRSSDNTFIKSELSW